MKSVLLFLLASICLVGSVVAHADLKVLPTEGPDQIRILKKLFDKGLIARPTDAPGCTQPGYTCTNSGACCGASFCDSGTCSGANCQPNGAPCQSGGDCCGSLFCQEGQCNDPTSNCYPSGSACENSGDCCGASFCDDGYCS